MDSDTTPAHFTSFALMAAVLFYSSLHVFVDADGITSSYSIDKEDVSVVDIEISKMASAKKFTVDFARHLKFLATITARIMLTMFLLMACITVLGFVANRLLVDTALGGFPTPVAAAPRSTDPFVVLTSSYLATWEGARFLLSVLAAHAIVMTTSVVYMRPSNMTRLEKQVSPKLKFYMASLLITTMLVIASEGIRLARRA